MTNAFIGFPRDVGPPGSRNHLLVLSVTGLSTAVGRRIAGQVRGARFIGTSYGSGLLGRDREIHDRALARFACHPNVGAVLVVGADPPAVARIAGAAEVAKRKVAALALDNCGHDALVLFERGVRAASSLAIGLSSERRAEVPVSELVLGLECGRSDPSSGLVANPLVGCVADRLVDCGATAILGETIEWLGAEDALMSRAVSPAVGDRIKAAVLRRERQVVEAGIDLTGNNPSATNIAGGLSTIEEKSLGAIAKSGRGPIQGVLNYGEQPADPGLWLMDAPAYAPESLTGFAIAGATMTLFTTGVGNSYGSLLMPTGKITGNPETASRLRHQIDFEASAVLRDGATIDRVTDELWDRVIEIASGKATWAEILGEDEETISRFGEAL
ncbi:MAG: UxaA family hydrolase [Geminicoccaceae bacterium]